MTHNSLTTTYPFFPSALLTDVVHVNFEEVLGLLSIWSVLLLYFEEVLGMLSIWSVLLLSQKMSAVPTDRNCSHQVVASSPVVGWKMR